MVGDRGVEGGSLTALPDPVRSCRPALVVGRRFGMAELFGRFRGLGMPETVSLRFFVGLFDLMVTSSSTSGFIVTDFPLMCAGRSKPTAGEFSFLSVLSTRSGEPSRVGVGIDEVCLCKAIVAAEGASGDSLIWRVSWRKAGSTLRGVCGDHSGTSSASCNVLRSLKEERRFLRGGPVVGGTSPIVPRLPTNDRPFAFEFEFEFEFAFSNVNAPRTVGRSREDGRFGDRRAAASIELERPRCPGPAFPMLGDWRSVPWLFLLNDRQSEPTLDSFSDLLFSRVKVPKPKRLRSDVLELSEPAAA